MNIKGILIHFFLVTAGILMMVFSCYSFKKNHKIIGFVAIIFSVLLLSFSLLMIIVVRQWNKPLKFVDHLNPPAQKHQFVLLKGKSTRSWHVFKLSTDINPKKYRVRENYMTNIGWENIEKGWEEKRVIYNSAEPEEPIGMAYIHIIENKYLVLIRNGLYQALYDIEKDSTFIDDKSTITSFLKSNSYNRLDVFHQTKDYNSMFPKPGTQEAIEFLVGNMRANVHSEIIKYLNKTEPSKEN